MSYSFDTLIERRGTDSLKYDFAAIRGKPEGILPLCGGHGFSLPPQAIEALEERCRHGIFGYSDAWAGAILTRFQMVLGAIGWRLSPEWLIKPQA